MTIFEAAEPSDNCHGNISDLYAYWRSIHPPHGLPGREQFDPADIPRLLPDIWMIDVVENPRRFRFRLVGTNITSFTGRDSTGKWLDEVYENFKDTGACLRMKKCVDEGRPIYQQGGIISNPEYEKADAERIYLPLASDGEHVDIIVVMTIYNGSWPSSISLQSSF